jgi:transcriptional regulator with XRE-family HTH domain
MTIEENKIQNYEEAKTIVYISIGESIKIIRELQDLSQNQLSAITGIPQSTISAIEHNKVNIGVERAKMLARALKCHPAVLVFPVWDIDEEKVA